MAGLDRETPQTQIGIMIHPTYQGVEITDSATLDEVVRLGGVEEREKHEHALAESIKVPDQRTQRLQEEQKA